VRKFALILAATAALTTGVALQAKERLTGEQQLAKLLEGREAGEPVSCIPLYRTNNTRIIDKTAIVYDTGRVIYVNRPRYPESLDSDDIMVTKLYSSQLCRLDTVKLHDRSGFWFNGFVGLEDFVPYRKVDRAN
jgi:hypothetical protein